MKKILLFLCFFCSVIGNAQSAQFSFGPRCSIGSSRFVGQAGSTRSGVCLQGSIAADWQHDDHFTFEFSPATLMYSGSIAQHETNGTTAKGLPAVYPYRDIYHIFGVEFPFLAQWSVGSKNVHFQFFSGAGLGYIMGGTHAKQYDDASYNALNGYAGHALRGLTDSYRCAIFGIGLEWKRKNGILGIDVRFGATTTIARIENAELEARSLTFGAAWKI